MLVKGSDEIEYRGSPMSLQLFENKQFSSFLYDESIYNIQSSSHIDTNFTNLKEVEYIKNTYTRFT